MLDQNTADSLIAEPKIFKDMNSIHLGTNGTKLSKELYGKNSQETFILDITRGKINISKATYQNRYKKLNIILARIDTSGPRHQNPDGKFINGPHLHIYRENYGDKWAYELDSSIFTNTSDIGILLKDFLEYINAETIPQISSSYNFT